MSVENNETFSERRRGYAEHDARLVEIEAALARLSTPQSWWTANAGHIIQVVVIMGGLGMLFAQQASRLTIIEERQLNVIEWRAEVKKQIDLINDKLEIGNRALNDIKLGLANKVDRRP